jgi:hypothetical protein
LFPRSKSISSPSFSTGGVRCCSWKCAWWAMTVKRVERGVWVGVGRSDKSRRVTDSLNRPRGRMWSLALPYFACG